MDDVFHFQAAAYKCDKASNRKPFSVVSKQIYGGSVFLISIFFHRFIRILPSYC